MPDAPSPHELARDMDQLERQWGSRLTSIEKNLDRIASDTSQILAEQARARQATSDHDRRISRLETDQTQNRRLVIGSLLFPILVIMIGATLMSGGGL